MNEVCEWTGIALFIECQDELEMKSNTKWSQHWVVLTTYVAQMTAENELCEWTSFSLFIECRDEVEMNPRGCRGEFSIRQYRLPVLHEWPSQTKCRMNERCPIYSVEMNLRWRWNDVEMKSRWTQDEVQMILYCKISVKKIKCKLWR